MSRFKRKFLSSSPSLQHKRDIGVLLISHDLAVVSDIADQIVVMEQGKVVEQGSPQAIFDNAQHPYTQKLLAAIPSGQKTADAVAADPLIRIHQLKTWFTPNDGAEPVKAVDDVSLEIHRGEVLGLVGESGSGKSTLGRSLLRLVPLTGGQIDFDGTTLSALQGKPLKQFRHRMQMIFQDPYASLNPRMTVYDTLAEPLLLHNLVSKAGLDQAIRELMDNVGLAQAFVRKYPHEFSGGPAPAHCHWSRAGNAARVYCRRRAGLGLLMSRFRHRFWICSPT
jgi:ABC-type microcin C transport system duplicated ATPase subunit YejF